MTWVRLAKKAKICLTEWLGFGAPAPQRGALNFLDPAVLWCELAPFPRTCKWLLRRKCWTNRATDWLTPADSWAWLQADLPPSQLDPLSREKGACGAVLLRASLKWLSVPTCAPVPLFLWVGVCSPPCAILVLERIASLCGPTCQAPPAPAHSEWRRERNAVIEWREKEVLLLVDHCWNWAVRREK